MTLFNTGRRALTLTLGWHRPWFWRYRSVNGRSEYKATFYHVPGLHFMYFRYLA